MTYKIEKGIPMPQGRERYPLDAMDVGDSFVAPAAKAASIRTRVDEYRKRTGRKYTVRMDGENCRVWRIE